MERGDAPLSASVIDDSELAEVVDDDDMFDDATAATADDEGEQAAVGAWPRAMRVRVPGEGNGRKPRLVLGVSVEAPRQAGRQRGPSQCS